jgi:hypothetical protein
MSFRLPSELPFCFLQNWGSFFPASASPKEKPMEPVGLGRQIFSGTPRSQG